VRGEKITLGQMEEEETMGVCGVCGGGSAVLVDRSFPRCGEGSGEGRIGVKRNASGAEPVHKGHQGSGRKRPEATQG
jgi:hypothetical protein